jgi:cytochrome c1
VFSLLTGYIDPPAGVEIRDGMNYNPYFPGGAISMERVLWDNLVEYDDGTFLFGKLAWPYLESRYRYSCHNLSDG